uniref:Uncharacterized protein LOC104220682 n=1 Tax=Nicotiana sylvestris TaxID=4096 RepID=A0A1U7W5I6_NICSY|nr:PREDICTED: uncharacterized protein LOC104220682 [Nicotiana sylvestris]
MSFPERWNFRFDAWMPHAIPARTGSGSWPRPPRIGDISKMRPSPSREETKSPIPKAGKDNNRKRVSKPEDPQDKKAPARRLRKRFAHVDVDPAHDSLDDEENDGEESALVHRTRKPIETIRPSELETATQSEGNRKKDSGKAPASPEVEIVPPPSTNILERVSAEALEANENAPSEELGAMTIGHSLSLPTYSEEAIEEANALRMLDPSKVLNEDPFQSCFAGVDDTADLNDASTPFEEDIVKFRAELSQCEAELRKVSGEEKALRLLYDQKEEELKDLRAELAKARQNETELDEQVTMNLTEYGLLGLASEANTLMSQLQQKLEMIGQLQGEVDQIRADCHEWKKNMDQLAADKEAVTAQLTSAETQLQGLKVKGMAQAKKIEELEAELARARAKAVQAKAEAEKTKVAADKSIVEKRNNYLAKCQARREILEEIHARGFNLAEEIAEAKTHETDARFLIFSDDEDVASGSGDGEGEKDVPKGEEAPKDKAVEDVVPEYGAPEDVTIKKD